MLASLKTSTNKEGNVLCILIAYCDAFGFERCLSDFLWMSSSVIGWPASSHEIGRNPKNIISPKPEKYNIAVIFPEKSSHTMTMFQVWIIFGKFLPLTLSENKCLCRRRWRSSEAIVQWTMFIETLHWVYEHCSLDNVLIPNVMFQWICSCSQAGSGS